MSKHLKSGDLHGVSIAGIEAVTGPLVPGCLVPDRVGAAALGIGKTKFWTLVKMGLLQPVRFGKRCTRFRSDEILTLIRGEA